MVYSRFHDREIDDATLKTIKLSIGENAEICDNALHNLKKKLLNVDRLAPCLDDIFLLRFLRVSKFNVNKAFDRICKYYQVKKDNPQLYNKFCPSACSTAIEARTMHASPLRTEEHASVIILKRGLFNPSTMNYEEMLLLDLMVLHHILSNPTTQICGIVIIIDFNGYTLQHFFEDTPRRLRIAVDGLQKLIPMRFRGIHLINAPSVFYLTYNIFYHFLPKKLRSRVCIHKNSDWKSLHSAVPPEILPEEYGGKISKSDLIDLTDELIHNEDNFKEMFKYGYNKRERNQ